MATVDEHAQTGLRAIEERRFDDAIIAFGAAVALAPERPDINHALGMAHIHRGDAGNALPHLAAAVRLAEPYDLPQHQPLKRDFQMSLATAYQLVDQVEEAKTVLERVIALWPDFVEAHLQLGQEKLAAAVLDEMKCVTGFAESFFVGPYALAASPARFAIERNDWPAAAALPVRPSPPVLL